MGMEIDNKFIDVLENIFQNLGPAEKIRCWNECCDNIGYSYDRKIFDRLNESSYMDLLSCLYYDHYKLFLLSTEFDGLNKRFIRVTSDHSIEGADNIEDLGYDEEDVISYLLENQEFAKQLLMLEING